MIALVNVTSFYVRLQPNDALNPFPADIFCSADEGHLLRITFFPPGQASAPNVTEPLYPDYPGYEDIFYGRIVAPSEQLVWFLDLLRNEKAWMALDSGDPSKNRLATDWAAVGWGHVE